MGVEQGVHLGGGEDGGVFFAVKPRVQVGDGDYFEGEGGEEGEGEDGDAEDVGVGVGGEDDGVDEGGHCRGGGERWLGWVLVAGECCVVCDWMGGAVLGGGDCEFGVVG